MDSELGQAFSGRDYTSIADEPTAGSPIGIVRDHDLTTAEIEAALRTNLFGAVCRFANLPGPILDLVNEAQQRGNRHLLEAAVGAVAAYKGSLEYSEDLLRSDQTDSPEGPTP